VAGQAGLTDQDAAPRSLDEARVGRLLVTARARKGYVESGHSELAALVHRSRSGARYHEGGRRVHVGQLRTHEGDDRVAARERGGQTGLPVLEPAPVVGHGVAAALVNDLGVL